MKNVFQYLAFGAFALIVSCKEDPAPAPPPAGTSMVVIANKGAAPDFGTVSTYDPKGKTVENFVFQKANIRYPGTGVNSVLVDGDITFIVSSGDGAVYAVNSASFKVIHKFEGMESPRHIIRVGDDKYYVSDWGVNGVFVLDMKTRRLIKELPTGVGPENMLLHDDKVFIVNNGGILDNSQRYDNTVTVYHAEEDTLMASIVVGENPNSLQIDKDGNIWVLSPGILNIDPTLSTPGDLRVIDPDSLAVTDTLVFSDNQQKPSYLQVNREGTVLYYLDNEEAADIMRFTIADSTIPAASFIPGNFSCLGYDAAEDELYAGNPFDVQQNPEAGLISRYSSDGAVIDEFKTSIAPVDFAFK